MENWISGAADRERQHNAVMAFINGHLWPQQVTCDRVTYANTPYGPIVAAFLGRTWENMKTWIDMSIIISWKRRRYPVKIDGRLWNQNWIVSKNLKNEIKVKED